jgi:alpha-tubulin suppressor-like RCC1 family protein
VRQDGKVVCWGINSGGLATHVEGIAAATDVSVGHGTACARLADGTIQCWGANDYGQLGMGTHGESDVPSTVTGITGAVAVSCGVDHTCAVLNDGAIHCWGADGGPRGDYRILGNPTVSVMAESGQ